MEKIFVTQPTLAPLQEYTELLTGIWASGIMTHNGPLVQRFEHDFCQYEKLDRMVAVSNGTIALQMAIRGVAVAGRNHNFTFLFYRDDQCNYLGRLQTCLCRHRSADLQP